MPNIRHIKAFILIFVMTGVLLLPSMSSTPLAQQGPSASDLTIVFQDDFEGDLSAWAVDETWTIEQLDGNHVLHGEVPEGGYAHATPRELPSLTDYTLEVRIQLMRGDVSIFFRNGDGFYDIIIRENHITLGKERGGQWRHLRDVGVAFRYGQWATLRIRGEGPTLTISFDGREVLSYTDPEPLLTGGIVFENRGYLHLDDVLIALDIPRSDALSWMLTAPPPAGGVWWISIAPSDPDVLYLATFKNNLYRSEDGGASWTAAGTQLGAHIFAPVAVHPQDPKLIYVSNGVIHLSQDGGVRFESLGIGSGDTMGVQAIAIAPSRPERVYAGDDTGTIYRTDNGGASWEHVGSFGPGVNIRQLIVDPTDPDHLYAEIQGRGIYGSLDGGMNWSPLWEGGISDRSLTMHPQQPQVLYLSDGSRIYRTTDAGTSWQPLPTSPPQPIRIAIAPSNPEVGYVLGARGLYLSADGGETWTLLADEVTFPDFPLAVAVDPRNAHRVYVGGEFGVMITTDGGQTWHASNEGLADRDIWELALDPQDPDHVYAGTFCMRGLFETRDGGTSWEWIPEHFHYVMQLAVHPDAPNTLYLTEEDGVFQSTDGGTTWQRLEGLEQAHFHGLAIDLQDANVIYTGSVGGGEFSASYAALYRSEDGGQSWVELWQAPQADVSVHDIAIDPTDSSLIYVATYRGGLSHRFGSGIGIYRSTDGGQTWTPINDGLTTPNIAAIAIDPFDPQRLYAATDQGLFVTLDRGDLWKAVDSLPALSINALAFDPTSPGTLYVSTEGAGLLRTKDYGVSWVSLGPPEVSTVEGVILDRAGQVIYLAVRGQGVYRAEIHK